MDRKELTVTITNPNAERLQMLVQGKLNDTRIENIVEQIAKKAEKGDIKAMDYLLTIGGFKPVAPHSVTVNQYYANGEHIAQDVAEET